MGFEQVIIQVIDDKKAAVKHDEDDEPPSSDEKIKQEEAEFQVQNSLEHKGKLILDSHRSTSTNSLSNGY